MMIKNIVKFLEDSAVLINDAVTTMKKKVKQQRGRFLSLIIVGSAADANIQKNVVVSVLATTMISNKVLKYIIKVNKSFEDSKNIELDCLVLFNLDVSLLGKILAG